MNANAASTQKGDAVSCRDNNRAGDHIAEGPSHPLYRSDDAPTDVVAAGAPQDIGQQQRNECVKKTDAYTVQHLRGY